MAEGNRLPSLENAPHLKTDGEFFRISTLQRHHYITSCYTYQYFEKCYIGFLSKHPTPMTIQLHPQCLLGIQSILRNWTFLIFKQV